jgi:hypothetical protein
MYKPLVELEHLCYNSAVITHLFEYFSLGELRILSFRGQHSLRGPGPSAREWVVIYLFQDCSTDFPFTIDLFIL